MLELKPVTVMLMRKGREMTEAHRQDPQKAKNTQAGEQVAFLSFWEFRTDHWSTTWTSSLQGWGYKFALLQTQSLWSSVTAAWGN